MPNIPARRHPFWVLVGLVGLAGQTVIHKDRKTLQFETCCGLVGHPTPNKQQVVFG